MKKILSIIFFMIISGGPVYAESKTVNLDVRSTYLIIVDENPVSFNISNPNLIKINTINTVENDKQQIIIQTLGSGATVLDINLPSSEKIEYRFNIFKDAKVNDTSVIELDIPEGSEEK